MTSTLNSDEEIIMREQSLTADIARVLKDYPSGTQIFRELLQNADDAGAKVFKLFLHEPKKSSTAKYLSSTFEKFQHEPALLVYNDGYFEEKDFEATRNLGKSSKVCLLLVFSF